MKSEHRHDLQTNDLSKLATQAGGFFEEHYNTILYSVCGVLLLSAGWIYWSRSTRNLEENAWNAITSSSSPEEFADVAIRFANTDAANWARLQEAQNYLRTGLQEAFSNREKSDADLQKAKKIYQELYDDRAVPAAVRERALFGLARCLEATSDGDLAAATKAYEDLLAQYPETAYKKEATQRIEALKSDGVQGFYAWFHEQNPKPPEPPSPQDGDGIHGGGSEPLEIPDILKPRLPLPGPGPRLDNETETEEPATPGEKPASETPAEKPATETPAETPETETPAEKPATEAPAAETPAETTPPAEKPATEAPATEAPAAEKPAEPATP